MIDRAAEFSDFLASRVPVRTPYHKRTIVFCDGIQSHLAYVSLALFAFKRAGSVVYRVPEIFICFVEVCQRLPKHAIQYTFGADIRARDIAYLVEFFNDIRKRRHIMEILKSGPDFFDGRINDDRVITSHDILPE